MNLKYVLNVFIFIVIALAIILFIYANAKTIQKGVKEGMDANIIMDKSIAFCESYRGASGKLNEACGKLTDSNCASTSCCVISNGKCVAGNAKDGSTYK